MRTATARQEAPTPVMTLRPPVPRFALRETEAAAAFGISPGTFRALVEAGKMPRPTYISPRIPLWDLDKLRVAWDALQDTEFPGDNNEWDE